jgi:hypothetical protein
MAVVGGGGPSDWSRTALGETDSGMSPSHFVGNRTVNTGHGA